MNVEREREGGDSGGFFVGYRKRLEGETETHNSLYNLLVFDVPFWFDRCVVV